MVKELVLGREFVGQSISEGTLKDADLLRSFSSFLEAHCQELFDELYMVGYRGVYEKYDFDWERFAESEPETAGLVIEELFDLLNSVAPKNCYFGSHPGDGASFGFWEILEPERRRDTVGCDPKGW